MTSYYAKTMYRGSVGPSSRGTDRPESLHTSSTVRSLDDSLGTRSNKSSNQKPATLGRGNDSFSYNSSSYSSSARRKETVAHVVHQVIDQGLIEKDTAGRLVGQKGVNMEEQPDDVKSQVDTLHFWDGVRKIDMVLAYEDDGKSPEDNKKAEKRKTFERNLKIQGLDLELEPSSRSADRKTNFLKVSAPWDILTRYAEIYNLKMPIKEENEMAGKLDTMCNGCRLPKPFNYDHDLIPPEPNFFNAGFLMEKEDRFIVKDRESFFSSAQRSQMVWQILMRTSYCDEDKDKVGIVRLLSNGVYSAAYPLHDGKYHEDGQSKELCARRILYLEWARPKRWYKKQPLWLIKRYFGDKIGLYFAWLGFYTQMLIPAAICGVCVFLYGIFTLNADWNYPSTEICNAKNVTMCPQCEEHCPFWYLDGSCGLSQFTYFFDNGATVFFAVFMSFWATTFIEFWKRRQAVIAWEWDLTNFEEEEQTRPEFEAHVKSTRINPVTKKPEPYLPPWNKFARVTITNTFVVLMLCVVLMAVFGVMVYRVTVTLAMYAVTKDGSKFFYSNSKLIISMSAAFLNLICIVILNKIYERIALWLTNMEHPRTQTDFEDNYTFKIFFFQCINFYSSLVYIAFLKGKFFKDPGDQEARGGLNRFKSDVCDPAGCIYELCIQLGIIMFGKQAFNNFIELLYPKMITWWKRYVYRKSAQVKGEEKKVIYTRWEQDYNLQGVDRLDLLDEYLEMVIQYGFVTLFVAAFPLAPFFALLNNIIEVRLDAYKYITTLRRPLSQRAQDIGAWANILQTITYISVFTNAVVISLTSEFIPKLVYMYGFSENQSTEGYIQWSLSTFNTADWGSPNVTDWPGPHSQKDNMPDVCYFKAQRTNETGYPLKEAFYHITAARLAFILVFQNTVMGLTGLVAVFIPDVPLSVKIQIQRERLLAREVLFQADLEEDQNKRLNQFNQDDDFKSKSNSSATLDFTSDNPTEVVTNGLRGRSKNLEEMEDIVEN